jgi:histidine triad (HIT) family protein
MKSNCKFCQIILKDAASEILYEDKNVIAFLDFRPVFKGHTLIIPKKHIDNFDDLPKNLMMPLLAAAQKIGLALEEGIGAHGNFLCLNNKVSQRVLHCHLHVIPRQFKDGMHGFFSQRVSYAAGEMIAYRDKIKNALDNPE